MTEKSPDEMYCRSCGEIIKKEAEICPECGVRNESAQSTQNQTRSTAASRTHDPSQYSTNVSDNWWYGVAIGVVLWVVIVLSTSVQTSGGVEALIGLVTVIAWILMPLAVYFDIQYVRANAPWNPNTALWAIGMFIWLVNIIVGAVYLYRRNEVLNQI